MVAFEDLAKERAFNLSSRTLVLTQTPWSCSLRTLLAATYRGRGCARCATLILLTCGCNTSKHEGYSLFRKVCGTAHIADLMTKHLCEKAVCKHIQSMDMDVASGRSQAAAQLHELRPSNVAGDSCDHMGKKGCWRRHHITWRRSLFTPMMFFEVLQVQVACVPGASPKAGGVMDPSFEL